MSLTIQECKPMATTSLKLSDELKQRVIAAAEKKGVSPHAFMVQAIERAATAAESRASFVSEAQAISSGTNFRRGVPADFGSFRRSFKSADYIGDWNKLAVVS